MTAHRSVHIGDVHLRPSNTVEVLAAFDQILDREQPNRVDLWSVLGDLFHTKSTIEDRNAIAPRLQRMADRAPVVIIYGNHDQPGDLDVFARLRGEWPIYVVTAPAVFRVLTPTGHVGVFGLPYPVKGGLVAGGVPHQDLNQAAAAALDATFMLAASQLLELRAQGLPSLMVAHANITGAVASNGQPQIGPEIAVDGAMLARLGNIPKLFGHIHNPQCVAGAYYAGSICRLDFGETEAKSYLSVEILADADLSPAIVRHELDVTPLYHVEGTLTRDSFEWAVTKGPGGAADVAPASWKGCGVRVRYRFPASEKSVLAIAQIHATFAEAKPYVLEPIAVPDRALRAPEVAAAITLQDKFAAYCALGGSPATPAMLEKLALLEQQDGIAVLSTVASTLDQIQSEEEAVLA